MMQMEREAEAVTGREKMGGTKRRRRLQRETEEGDRRTLKALKPCQQGEEQANNAAQEVRAALQIVNKWHIYTLLIHTVQLLFNMPRYYRIHIYSICTVYKKDGGNICNIKDNANVLMLRRCVYHDQHQFNV